jgi:hypothetical protein
MIDFYEAGLNTLFSPGVESILMVILTAGILMVILTAAWAFGCTTGAREARDP